MHINDMLDRIPRSHVRIGNAVVPTYFVFGLAGIAAGTVAMITVTLLVNLNLLVTLSLVPIACTTLVVTTLIRRWIRGTESLVLLEQFAFVLAASAGVLYAAGIVVWPYLDVIIVGLAMFLVFGRIGCFVGGCCYGRAASIGVCYPRECGHEDHVRRAPLQLVEVLLWLGLTTVAALLAAARHDGSATAATLAGYGVGRLALEPLRGDPRRRLLGATEGQWLSILAIAAAIGASEPHRPPWSEAMLAASALALVVLLWATVRWWLARDRGFAETERASIRALAPVLCDVRFDARVQTWRAASLLFAASALEDERLLLSVSSPDRPLVRAEAALALATLAEALGSPLDHDPIDRGNGLFAVEVPRNHQSSAIASS